jgi:hypothetical protein
MRRNFLYGHRRRNAAGSIPEAVESALAQTLSQQPACARGETPRHLLRRALTCSCGLRGMRSRRRGNGGWMARRVGRSSG